MRLLILVPLVLVCRAGVFRYRGAAGSLEARGDAIQSGGTRSAPAAGDPEIGRCFALDGIDLLAAERSGRLGAVSTRRKTPTCAGCLRINGCRWDLIDENKPFTGSKPIPPGRNLYPEGLTRAQIEAYVKAHPERKRRHLQPLYGAAVERKEARGDSLSRGI